ncbi:MAG: DUF72 domain-containing protein, partial [Fervidobacterium sp.]
MEKESVNLLAGKDWYIGTSGFSFEDWVGTVYPEGIKQSEMFTYYWQHYGFNAVEINFTFYQMPSIKTLVALLRKAPPKFKFSIKLHGSITHEGYAEKLETFLRVTQIYEEENRLLGYLAQFPFGFRKEQENVSYLIKLLNISAILAEGEIIKDGEIKTKGNPRDVALLILLDKAKIKRE